MNGCKFRTSSHESSGRLGTTDSHMINRNRPTSPSVIFSEDTDFIENLTKYRGNTLIPDISISEWDMAALLCESLCQNTAVFLGLCCILCATGWTLLGFVIQM